MNLRNSIEAFLNSYDVIKMLSSDWLTSSGQNNKIGHQFVHKPYMGVVGLWMSMSSGYDCRCGGVMGMFELFPKVVGPTDLRFNFCAQTLYGSCWIVDGYGQRVGLQVWWVCLKPFPINQRFMNLRNSTEAFFNSYDVIKMPSSDWLTSSGQNNRIDHQFVHKPYMGVVGQQIGIGSGQDCRCGGVVGVFEAFPKVVQTCDSIFGQILFSFFSVFLE